MCAIIILGSFETKRRVAMRLLIVEDNERLACTLVDLLDENGYDHDVVFDGLSGYDYACNGSYDAIILDVMLPGMNGFDILKKLRQQNISTPVLILTAKSELEDRIHGLDYGADYYLTKPFNNEELLACLRALLRRQPNYIPDNLQYGDLSLNVDLSELHCGASMLPLNPKELELLKLLMLNTNSLLSKDTLITRVWGYDSDATFNNVEAYISFLRKKLSLLHSCVQIVSVTKAGYRLELKTQS